MCFPDSSSLVEHQNLPLGSSLSVQELKVLSSSLNGNRQVVFLILDPDSLVVLHFRISLFTIHFSVVVPIISVVVPASVFSVVLVVVLIMVIAVVLVFPLKLKI